MVEAAVSRGIRPRLLVVWLVLLVLVGAILVIERPGLGGLWATRGGPDDIASDPRRLLPVPVDELGAIEVAHAGAVHRFERDASGAWFYHGAHTGSEAPHDHVSDPAMAARIEHAFAGFGRTRVERQLAPEGQSSDAYGVVAPEMLVLVYRPHDLQPLARYAVGDVAPDRLSRYVQAIGSPVVVTIPDYQIDNLLALIAAVRNGSNEGSGTTGVR
jgi:hypothetical protein